MRMKFIVINIMLKHAESKQLAISKQHYILGLQQNLCFTMVYTTQRSLRGFMVCCI